jgi:chemotaxis protein CheD
MYASADPSEKLITYSLGSCLGLTLFDPIVRIGGLLHSMLPNSQMNKEKAAANPSMFTDSGIVALLQALLKAGAHKADLVAKIAGCGAPLHIEHSFQIGEKNHVIARKLLWKNSIMIAGEDVGGSHPRTMSLYMATGQTTVKTDGQEYEL